jgi:hypothetical protein
MQQKKQESRSELMVHQGRRFGNEEPQQEKGDPEEPPRIPHRQCRPSVRPVRSDPVLASSPAPNAGLLQFVGLIVGKRLIGPEGYLGDGADDEDRAEDCE